MKKLYIFCILVFAGCDLNPSQENLNDQLKATMTDYLYKKIKYDSSKVKYRVEEVVFFNDEKLYECEFKVKMIVPGKQDTTGTMRANISKDFKTVTRLF